MDATNGHDVWNNKAIPRINASYEQALVDFSVSDMTHTVHYMLKMLDNMKRVDEQGPAGDAG